MNLINSRRPLHVKLIRFANGETLEERTVFVTETFLIVDGQSEDQDPTWYNLRNVDVLQEVSVETVKEQQSSPGPNVWRI